MTLQEAVTIVVKDRASIEKRRNDLLARATRGELSTLDETALLCRVLDCHGCLTGGRSFNPINKHDSETLEAVREALKGVK